MIVTPYGDPNAHGTLGKTLIFQRRRGGVFVKPYKIPKDPKSSGQLAQRQLFNDAVEAWYALSSQSRDFYNERAEGTALTGYNLFISNFMNGTLPSTTPFELLDIEFCTIGFLRGSNFNSWKYTFSPSTTGTSWGYIWDNQNTFNDGAVSGSLKPLKIVLNKISEDLNIEFRDTVTITYDGSQQLTIFLPAVISNITLYVSQDGSTYFDSSFSQLACSAGV